MMSDEQKKALLKTALRAADVAAHVIAGFRDRDVAVQVKADATPVTEVDVAVEKEIRQIIAQDFPDHGFYGEETGSDALDADTLWLVDPIDGTKSYVRGYPMYSTQIAVMHCGELIVGVSDASHFNQRAWAVQGGGAWLNGQPITTSDISELAQISLSSGNIASLAASEQWQAYGRLLTQVSRTRGYGDYYHYHLLAEGCIDVVIESDVNILDIAALSVIVREAGGVFSDLAGGPVGLDTRSVLAAANPAVYGIVAEYLNA